MSVTMANGCIVATAWLTCVATGHHNFGGRAASGA
jgi:hypothetical protein